MTLTTHAIVGTAAASLFPQMPVAAFAAGFVSHFIIDSIPHWDEGHALLRSPVKDKANELNNDMPLGKDFLHDIVILGADALCGFMLSVLLFHVWLFQLPLFFVLCGAAAGVLPDALQFLYFKTHWRVMTPLQKFHIGLQTHVKNPLMVGVELGLIGAILIALTLW